MLKLFYSENQITFGRIPVGTHFRIPGSYSEEEVYIKITPLKNSALDTVNCVTIRNGDAHFTGEGLAIAPVTVDAYVTDINPDAFKNEASRRST